MNGCAARRRARVPDGIAPARVLAGEHALRERAEDDLRRAPRARRSGSTFDLDAAAQQRVLRLVRDRAVGEPRVGARGRPRRSARRATPRRPSRGPCPGGPGPRRRSTVSSIGVVRIGAVALVQVDVVGAEPAQRGLDALEEVLAREPAVVRVLRHREEGLGRDHQVAARDRRAAPAPSASSACAVRVDVGGVEEVDAEVVGARARSRASPRGRRSSRA